MGDVTHVHEVAHLPAVLEDRRRLPASERGAKHRRHPRVRRVGGHVGAVDVVVAQRDRGAGQLACPGGGEVLLRDLAGCVAALRVEAGIFVDKLPLHRLATHRTTDLKPALPQRLETSGGCVLVAMLRARVAAVAVHDHRGREDEPVHTGRGHGGEHDGGAEVVVAGVERQVTRCEPRAHHCGLVAHHAHPIQQSNHGVVVANICPEQARVDQSSTVAVRLRDERVDANDVVAPRAQGCPCRATDESGSTRQQHLDGVAPSS